MNSTSIKEDSSYVLQMQVAAYVTNMAMAWFGGRILIFLTKGIELSVPFTKWEYNFKPSFFGKIVFPATPGQLLFGFLARSLFGDYMKYYPIFFAQQVRNIIFSLIILRASLTLRFSGILPLSFLMSFLPAFIDSVVCA